MHSLDTSWKRLSNFLENHGLGVTWSHAWVFGDKENIEISLFLRLGLTWVCSVVTRVFLVVRTGVTECTRCHSVSLGFTWFHLVSLGVTRFHSVSLSITWCHSVSLGVTRCHLDSVSRHSVSLGVTLFHLDSVSRHSVSLGFTWFHMVSLRFICVTWFHLVSHGFTWFHLVSLGASQGPQHTADSDAAI